MRGREALEKKNITLANRNEQIQWGDRVAVRSVGSVRTICEKFWVGYLVEPQLFIYYINNFL